MENKTDTPFRYLLYKRTSTRQFTLFRSTFVTIMDKKTSPVTVPERLFHFTETTAL